MVLGIPQPAATWTSIQGCVTESWVGMAYLERQQQRLDRLRTFLAATIDTNHAQEGADSENRGPRFYRG
jgi:hypothetical protein